MVSENYGRELQETDDDSRTGWLGHELLKRGVKLAGVTNGISPEDFNPQNPKGLGLDAEFNIEKSDFTGNWALRETGLTNVAQSGRQKAQATTLNLNFQSLKSA